jgi:hypothetical protein
METTLTGRFKLRLPRYQWVAHYEYKDEADFFNDLLRAEVFGQCLRKTVLKDVTPAVKSLNTSPNNIRLQSLCERGEPPEDHDVRDSWETSVDVQIEAISDIDILGKIALEAKSDYVRSAAKKRKDVFL